MREFILVEGVGDDRPVFYFDLAGLEVRDACEGVLHPLSVISLWEVVPGVRASALLSVFGSVNCLHGALEQVLQLQSLNEIRVPSEGSVLDANVWQHRVNFAHFLHPCPLQVKNPQSRRCTFFQSLLDSENGGVLLHGPLHLVPNLCSMGRPFCVTVFVESLNRLLTSPWR